MQVTGYITGAGFGSTGAGSLIQVTGPLMQISPTVGIDASPLGQVAQIQCFSDPNTGRRPQMTTICKQSPS